VNRKRANGSRASSGRTKLEARDLKVHFDGVHAVNGVDIALTRGEIVGLIGPNGADKTTMLNTLTGFQRPTSGRVLLDEQDVSRWSVARLARAGVARTFQSERAFGQLTVRENLEVAALGSGSGRALARRRADEITELLGVRPLSDLPAAGLSYGQGRRVELGRALATDPSFLLLDEPAAGLDEVEGRELVSTVRHVRDKSSCGVCVVDHDMDVIMRVCERIVVLDHGTLIASGTPADVRKEPAVRRAYLGGDLEAR
jgi:branched-chain amino acid transport system ATP-binding protein